MNKHLNIFKTYTDTNRSYQLENDLTRALAICFQEDPLFFHEVLKTIIADTNLYNQLFEDLDGEMSINIEIQKQTSKIDEFSNVFAVTLSESEMSDFWAQTHTEKYDPICDLVITINSDVLIVIEAKRDNIDCTAQLYNQVLNIFSNQDKNLEEYKSTITPFDLNWKKLMAIAVKIASFQKTTSNSNRFLIDFIKLVRGHNHTWLPETPLASLKSPNAKAIYRRLESALIDLTKKQEHIKMLSYGDRLGTDFSQSWANELLFGVDSKTGDIEVSIYPGNTKGQGYAIFNKPTVFSKQLEILGKSYSTTEDYHIKFMGQSYITGLWLSSDAFKEQLYTTANFHNHTGRIKREQWSEVENLLDKHLNIDWRTQANWQDKIINSNRSLFNVAFGYHITITIPFASLASIDKSQNDLVPLSNFLHEIYKGFETNLIQEVINA